MLTVQKDKHYAFPIEMHIMSELVLAKQENKECLDSMHYVNIMPFNSALNYGIVSLEHSDLASTNLRQLFIWCQFT